MRSEGQASATHVSPVAHMGAAGAVQGEHTRASCERGR